MSHKLKRERVDLLIDHLWKEGYLTLSRKFGKYLPSPPPIGGYEVDAISQYKKKIAIGLAVQEEELNDIKFISKLETISSYKRLHPMNRITVFLGVPYNSVVKVTMLISTLPEEVQKHIKIITLPDNI